MAISKDLLIIGLLNPRLIKSPKLLPVLDFRVEFGDTFDGERVRGLYTVCEDITLFVSRLPMTLTKPKTHFLGLFLSLQMSQSEPSEHQPVYQLQSTGPTDRLTLATSRERYR
jgi:hypothetical protein